MKTPGFIDLVTLYVKSGNGGAGSVHFRREKFVPRGGPDGGDGGDGGNIILRADPHINTLLHLKYRKHVVAANGMPGGDKCKHGAGGKSAIIKVPLGTVISMTETPKPIIELTKPNEDYVLLTGGRGGRGNAHFKHAQRQAPRYAQPGEQGQEAHITLELKMLADVGIIGLPNAGKSTLLSKLSAAKPKIASYPFTTLHPQLGIVDFKGCGTWVMADIPGLIEGASRGKGLGARFLRHVTRNAILLFLVDATSSSPLLTYQLLLRELAAYNPILLQKRRVLALSKMDLITDVQQKELLASLPKHLPVLGLSSFTRQGLLSLKQILWRELHNHSS